MDHNGVTGVAEGKGSTILRNVPAYDQDAVDDRPSIRVKDQDFQGFFTSKDEHAVITVEMEKELCQKYSDISYWGRMAIVDTKPFKLRVILQRIFVERPQVTGIPAWSGGAACYRRSRYIL